MTKEYYQEHRLEIIQKNSDYRNKHRKEIKELSKKYRETHKEQINLSNKNWRNNHKLEIKQLGIDYRRTHKKQIKENSKIYLQTHKMERNKYQRNKRKTNINFKIEGNLRKRIWNSLNGFSKSNKTVNLLGCSIESLKQHLESQFKLGMSWSNYGKWHIDHKIPCASFDLSKSSEQYKCFHYTNLQPLWAKENLIKGKKF